MKSIMAPNKQWMQQVDNCLDEAYSTGVQEFLDYAFGRTGELYEIRCPCVKCCYTTLGTRQIVESHLKIYGIVQNYSLGSCGSEVGCLHQNALHGGRITSAPSNSKSSGSRISASQGIQTASEDLLVFEKEQTQTDIPLSPPSNQSMPNQNALHAGQSMPSPSNSTCVDSIISAVIQTVNNLPMVLEEEYLQNDIPFSPSTDLEEEHLQTDIRLSPSTDQNMEHQNALQAGQSIPTPSNSTSSDATISAVMQMPNKHPLAPEKEHLQTDIPLSPSTDHSMEPENDLQAGQSMPTPSNSTSSDTTVSAVMQTPNKHLLVREEEHLQTDIPLSPSTDQVMQNQDALPSGQSMSTLSNSTSSDSTISGGHRTQTANKSPIVLEEEQMQTDIPLPPSADQVMQSTQTDEASSCAARKVKKRVRGSNKCKEVAALEDGEKLKVTFYNNRTVGENSSVFSRHLGKLIRDRHMCPLGVSSWNDIKEETLNRMWAAVEDKFESDDDMNSHRDHIMGWMKELWNKWRGQLYGKYVKGKPVEEALKNKPKGVDKKQWEWLIKEHFSGEKFQAKSNRNAANRAKLKMPHRSGSKPIREIIYQKGGKDGNPPDLATIFFETHKKDDKLVESETIEKHAQIQEVVKSEPSLPSIEVVEKCFGPQTRSHVYGFGGGVKAKDLKGPPTSKAELMSELRSTQKENQTLNDRLSAIENEMKELKQLKEFLLAQRSSVQPSTSAISKE